MRFPWRVVVIAALLMLTSAATLEAQGVDPVRTGDIIAHITVDFEHNGKNHPGGGPPGGGSTDDGHTTDHYTLQPGKWAGINPSVTYVVEDPGLPGAVAAVEASFEAWDAASGINFDCQAPCGTQSVNANTEVSGSNGTNTVSWALLVGGWSNALAVTITWVSDLNSNGVWDSGEPIVEADILFNSKYKWAIAEDDPRGKWFDIENVGAHEAGHVVGLGHVGAGIHTLDRDEEQTMFLSAPPKETKKRSLELDGDSLGAVALYGSP